MLQPFLYRSGISPRAILHATGTVLLAACLSACSFLLSRGGRDDAPDASDLSPISERRFSLMEANRTFVCLYSLSDAQAPFLSLDASNQPVGIEPDIVRALAKIMDLSVEFRKTDSFRVPALIRQGRGDMAIGAFLPDQILRLSLDYLAVSVPTEQAPSAKHRPVLLMIRNADPRWKAKISAAIQVLASAEQMTEAQPTDTWTGSEASSPSDTAQ